MPAIRRTSFNGGTQAAQLRLRNVYSRLADATTKVSTNKAYQRPSENVSAASRAALLQDQSDQLKVFSRSIDDAKSRLSYADDTLGQAMDLYGRLTELGIQAGNPIANASVKQSIRQEVIDIRKALEDIANSAYLGEPVFGGTGGDKAVTFDTGTNTWQFAGDASDTITRRIGKYETVRVNVTAKEAFSAAGTDVFTMLDDFAAALDADDNTAANAAINKLSSFRSALSAAQAQVGSATQTVEKAGLRNSSLAIRLEEELTNVRDVDLGDAITDQQRLSIAYDTAIAVTAKTLNKSLLDWLR